MLTDRLHTQGGRGSDYFVGDEFAAADLYWACFSQLMAPMAEAVNPMPHRLRATYEAPETTVIDPILLAHRDKMCARNLSLPPNF